MVLWLQFIACTGIILISGTYLSKYGDVIAEVAALLKETGFPLPYLGTNVVLTAFQVPRD